MLLLCIFLVTFLYTKYINERRKWLDTINKELNRVTPSHSNNHDENEEEEEEEHQSHWNYGQDQNLNEYNSNVQDSSTSRVVKIDKSSQYDYSAFQSNRDTMQLDKPSTDGYYRERLIPIGNSVSQNYEPDYDRISYMRTHETLQEIKKYPNILEVQLNKETQSIVQEIRKELDRYNFKKIISQPNSEHSSSEA